METETHSLEEIITAHPFFSDLESYYITLMARCASNVRFDAGQFILREGEEANEFFLIREGRVQIELSPPHRKPIVVDTVDEGDILGWSSVLPPYLWKFDARAETLTRAVALDAKFLRTKCEKNHDLGYELLRRLSDVMNRRLDATRIQLLDVYATR
jgi:CRP/FNR family transcriptional regulator, cyclic AMP receptor protein